MITAIHTAVKGRARYKVTGLYGSVPLKRLLEVQLVEHAAIQGVSASTLTGNVLVHFYPDTSPEAVASLLADVITDHADTVQRRDGAQEVWSATDSVHQRSAADAPAASRRAVRRAVTQGEEQGRAAWHLMAAEAVLATLETSHTTGLSSAATQDRLRRYGPNLAPESVPRSSWSMLLEQFTSLPVALLGVAAGISLLTGGIADALVIAGVVAMNATIGYVTESQSEQTIHALKSLVHPSALTLRDGQGHVARAEEVVPGDILVLRPGSYVAADARLLEAQRLSVDESALTGESLPVTKNTAALTEAEVPLAERHNMVYAGTLVTGGQGLAAVIATGQHTEMGQIQALVDVAAAPETPLQRLPPAHTRGGEKLHAGGLQIRVNDGAFGAVGEESAPLAHTEVERLMHVSVLCSETEIVEHRNGEYVLRGSPTENALLHMAITAGVNVVQLRQHYPLLHMQHRAEQRNYMSTLHMHQHGQLLAVKGSPNEVLALCAWHVQNGQVAPLTEADCFAIGIANDRMAGEALRVLGTAYRESDGADGDASPLHGLTWLGLIGMADPVRPGVQEVIADFHQAGIDTVMITGDQSTTAYAIGKELRLSRGEQLEILDSTHVTGVDPEVMTALTSRVHVFARVSPSHKLQIVQALQRSGKVVAMTGDGINDGPAPKVADIGIAMGNTGTDVAREVADMVLEDDHLETMLIAVSQGRTIYNNIRKSVHFLLATNLSEIMVMCVALSTGLGQPLNAMQLLWINLLSDVAPGRALALEPPEPEVLQQPPRDPAEPIITSADFKRIGLESALLSAGTLSAYGYGLLRYGMGPQANTLAFSSLTIGQLLHTFSCRSQTRSLFGTTSLPTNPYLQVSDAIVDRFLQQDPYARIIAECATSTAILFIAARFDARASVDFSAVARQVIDHVGYAQPTFNSQTCSIVTSLKELPSDGYRHFDEEHLSDAEIDRIPVKNQVTVFGFACKQTPACLPLPIWLTHQLARRLTAARRTGLLPYLAPDGTTQVGIEYRQRRPHRIHSLTVVASQNALATGPTLERLQDDVRAAVQVQTFGTGTIPDDAITTLVAQHFDFRLAGIIRQFQLRFLPTRVICQPCIIVSMRILSPVTSCTGMTEPLLARRPLLHSQRIPLSGSAAVPTRTCIGIPKAGEA